MLGEGALQQGCKACAPEADTYAGGMRFFAPSRSWAPRKLCKKINKPRVEIRAGVLGTEVGAKVEVEREVEVEVRAPETTSWTSKIHSYIDR